MVVAPALAEVVVGAAVDADDQRQRSGAGRGWPEQPALVLAAVPLEGQPLGTGQVELGQQRPVRARELAQPAGRVPDEQLRRAGRFADREREPLARGVGRELERGVGAARQLAERDGPEVRSRRRSRSGSAARRRAVQTGGEGVR